MYIGMRLQCCLYLDLSDGRIIYHHQDHVRERISPVQSHRSDVPDWPLSYHPSVVTRQTPQILVHHPCHLHPHLLCAPDLENYLRHQHETWHANWS